MSYSDYNEDEEMSEEDEMEDDTLTPLERLQKYKESDLLLQRCVLCYRIFFLEFAK